MRWIFLESIDELKPGELIRGTMTWPEDLEIFQDHFPGWPVVPGVLLLEAMAQLAGKAIGYTVRLERGDWPFPILSMIQNVKFRRFVKPGETVQLEAVFVSLREESCVVKVKARVDGKVRAQAQEIFVFNAAPLEDEAHRKKLESIEGAELARLWKDFDPQVWQ